jgi:autotransporter-associated beta strand protein
MYGLSNEEVPGSLDGATVLNITNDCVFGGAITGGGPFTKTGAGSFTVTGNSTATGPVAVNAGVFGVANGGTATLGPVTVAPGATLFGSGRVGGHVTVASNAWLQAGTASACGTLQVGGGLALAQGAQLAWRFDTAAADAFTVGGPLTFPTNGVVQAQALTAGVMPPAKTALFTSTQTINGPAELTGWSVAGVGKASLTYSGDRTIIYLASPRGTMILIR